MRRMREPRVGVCGAHAELRAVAGEIDFAEEGVQRLLVPEQPDAAFAPPPPAALAALPIAAANGFLPGDLRSTGPEVDLERLRRYAAAAFRRARQVGIGIVVYGSGASRQVEEGFDRGRAEQQFVEALQTVGPPAAAAGVTVVVEPLNTAECNIINSVTEGAEAVRAAGHPHVMLLADLYHMLREDESPAAIERAGTLIRHVHVAEVAERTPPGVAGDDFRPFLRALARTGYAGAYSLECRWRDQLAEAPPGVAELRRQLAAVE